MRKKEDPFVHIRGLWSQFVENCTTYYSHSVHCTTDEQLLGFRGRCPFRVYIPNKPDKYGIKIVMICDSHTFYFISGMPYLDKAKPNGHITLTAKLDKKYDVFCCKYGNFVCNDHRNIICATCGDH
jgi:hypothetical protein